MTSDLNYTSSCQVEHKAECSTFEQVKLQEGKLKPASGTLLSQHSILWSVKVHSDGWGDFLNCLNAFALTKLQYPNWDMRIYATINAEKIPFSIDEYGLKSEELLVISLKNKDAELLLDGKTNRLEQLFECKELNETEREQVRKKHQQIATSSLSDLAQKIDAFIQFSNEADLMIGVSSALPPPRLSKFDFSSPKYIHFVEYGAIPVTPPENTLSMGVGPRSCGIYILQPKVPTHFADPVLQHHFDSNKSFYFNYGWDIQGYTSLINRLRPDAKEIHIVTNSPLQTIKQMNIEGNCTISFMDKKGIETTIASPEHSEKKICFINPFPLDHNDMIRAIKISQEPVGITGNNTLSEAIALDKLPFYNNRSCLQPFWEQLIELATHALPQHTQLISYLHQMSFQLSLDKNHIGEYGQNSHVNIEAQDLSNLQKQWEDLVKLLRQDWDVKNAYLGEINRRIDLQKKV